MLSLLLTELDLRDRRQSQRSVGRIAAKPLRIHAMLGRDRISDPPFWNISRMLRVYFEALLATRVSEGLQANDGREEGVVPSKTLNRAWENAFDAYTAKDALYRYKVIASLLAVEVSRIEAMDRSAETRKGLLTDLRRQQVDCANNVLRLQDVISRNEQIVLPF